MVSLAKALFPGCLAEGQMVSGCPCFGRAPSMFGSASPAGSFRMSLVEEG